MKVRVTHPKAHDADGKPIPVGTILTVDGDVMPMYLVNKAELYDASVAKAEVAAQEAADKAVEAAEELEKAKAEADAAAVPDEADTHETDKKPASDANAGGKSNVDPAKVIAPATDAKK